MAVVQLHPAAGFNLTSIGQVVLTLSGADIDLTDTTGPTGGYCSRAFLIGGTAGNVKYKDMLGNTVTQAVAANQILECEAQYVFSTANGTTATSVSVLL